MTNIGKMEHGIEYAENLYRNCGVYTVLNLFMLRMWKMISGKEYGNTYEKYAWPLILWNLFRSHVG